MHRTQISIEEAQYQKLCVYAQQQNRSISAIIRELLDQHVPDLSTKNQSVSPLMQLKGIVSGEAKVRGRDHNNSLYQHEKRWHEK